MFVNDLKTPARCDIGRRACYLFSDPLVMTIQQLVSDTVDEYT
jgi:hypothetical protein